MLTEAVLDGSQAMRDPVGGSVEFHFVPILKLISTLLIMGIFNDEDTKHILKMIDPNVFSGKEQEEEKEKAEEGGAAEGEGEEAKEDETEDADEAELEDEGVGDEEEEELKNLGKGDDSEESEMREEGEEEEKEQEGEATGGKVDGEKVVEEKEAEAAEAEVKDEEEGLEEGLLQMKLPESVKLQVISMFRHTVCLSLDICHIFTDNTAHTLPVSSPSPRCVHFSSTSVTVSCDTEWKPSWPIRTSLSMTFRTTSASGTTS